MKLYTNFKKLYFSWKFIFPLLLYLGMLGLRWLCMHFWLNLINQTSDIQEKLKIVKIHVQSQWRVVLLWYHRFWQRSVQRGRHTKLCIISSLKRIIQICSKCYCWVSKIAFYSPNPHILLFGETSLLTCRRRTDFATTRISHRHQPEYTRD